MPTSLSAALSTMSIDELVTHIAEAQSILDKKRTDARREFVKETKRKSESLGIPLSELLSAISEGKSEPRKKKDATSETRKVPPKYRDPDNPMNVWSGRGMQPKWVRAKLDAGSTIEGLLIP